MEKLLNGDLGKIRETCKTAIKTVRRSKKTNGTQLVQRSPEQRKLESNEMEKIKRKAEDSMMSYS